MMMIMLMFPATVREIVMIILEFALAILVSQEQIAANQVNK